MRRATGADLTGRVDDAKLLATYRADEFVATYPREFTSAQSLGALETLGEIIAARDGSALP